MRVINLRKFYIFPLGQLKTLILDLDETLVYSCRNKEAYDYNIKTKDDYSNILEVLMLLLCV